jgi:hypothetical protein
VIRALVFAASLAAPGLAANAPAPSKKAAPLARAAGRIAKAADGRITVAGDAGIVGDFLLDAGTKITCDGKKAAAKSAVPGACDRAIKVMYEARTRRVRVLELTSALKADAADAKTRPNVSGEVAATDVIAGKISVRLGGGTTLDFKVGEGAKILREAEGKEPESVSFESVKVGDLAEVRSADWKNADEIRVRAAR